MRLRGGYRINDQSITCVQKSYEQLGMIDWNLVNLQFETCYFACGVDATNVTNVLFELLRPEDYLQLSSVF